MRETRLYGSEGGEAKAFPTPIPYVRLKVRNARGVKVPFRENAFRPVTDRNGVVGSNGR